MTVNKRIKLVREYLKQNQSEFSFEINVKQKDISRLESGVAKFVPNNVINTLHDKLNVNLNWLFSGSGEMFRDDLQSVAKVDLNDNINHSEVEISKIKLEYALKEVDNLKVLINDKQEIIDLLKQRYNH